MRGKGHRGKRNANKACLWRDDVVDDVRYGDTSLRLIPVALAGGATRSSHLHSSEAARQLVLFLTRWDAGGDVVAKPLCTVLASALLDGRHYRARTWWCDFAWQDRPYQPPSIRCYRSDPIDW